MKLSMFCLAAIGMFILFASVALAGDQDFKVVNKTGIEIHKLFVSPHSSDEWGEDILGRDTLDDGESVNVKFATAPKPRTGISRSKTKRVTR
jgi:hypothetical protein